MKDEGNPNAGGTRTSQGRVESTQRCSPGHGGARRHSSHWSKMTFSWFLLSCNSFRVLCNFFSCSNSFLWSLLISAFSSPRLKRRDLGKKKHKE